MPLGKVEEGSPNTLRTVALWDRNKIVENLTFVLKGTPCEKVIDQETGGFPQNAQNLFPQDQYLVDWGIHSYLGVPLINSEINPSGYYLLWMKNPFRIMNIYTPFLIYLPQDAPVK